ncbi:MAG: hypothetical protein AAF202_02290 [Pseudomonadota bacterium]
MKSEIKKLTFAAVLGLALSGCIENQEVSQQESVDEVAMSVESGLLAISEIADDGSGTEASSKALLESNETDVSAKSVCPQPAYFQRCDDGKKSVRYDSCQPAYALGSLDGFVELNHSQSDCDMSLSGDEVARTYDLTYTTRGRRKIKVSSARHEDYEGNLLGGGGLLTKTSTGFEIDVLGKNRKLIGRSGRTLINVSIATAESIVVDGSLRRAERTVVSGEILVAHNRAKFTTSLKPNNLVYNEVCCHPISGSVDIDFTGSRNGSGTVTFLQCGQAQIDTEQGSRTLNIENCR